MRTKNIGREMAHAFGNRGEGALMGHMGLGNWPLTRQRVADMFESCLVSPTTLCICLLLVSFWDFYFN